jgi:membrane fusion protein (multidrug efflux system)
MKSNTYSRYTLLLALALVVAACGQSTDKKAELEKLKKEQAALSTKITDLEKEIAAANPDSEKVKSKDVDVLELQPRVFNHYVQTQGHVEAEDNIMVSSKGMGVITQVYAKEGQLVSKGQVLAQIDNSLILRNIEGMKSQLELATSVYERQKNLWDQQIGTEVQYLQAKTAKESLEKQLEGLQEQNDMTRIKSPINGAVDEVSIKIGQNIAPGQPAARVVNTSDLKIVADISESFVTNVKKGNQVEVKIPELKRNITGTVTFVGKTIDLLSRTFAVEVKLPSEANLSPNMSAVLKVIYHTSPTAIVVPVNTVQDVNGEKIVYIAEMDGKNMVARKKKVEVLGVFGNGAEVSGLKAGDKIVTVGYQSLSDGEFIKI